MALIKCKKCGKEISDKAKVCVNCGCPIASNNIKNKKKYNNIGLIIGGIITLVISLLLFMFGNIDIEFILYTLLGVTCLYLSILFFVLWKRKSNKKKINIFSIVSIISFLVFCFCLMIYIVNWDYIVGGRGGLTLEIHIFYKDECPYCDNAIQYISNNYIRKKYVITDYDVDVKKELFSRVKTYFAIEEDNLPLIVINDKYIIGYDEEKIKTTIEQEQERYKNFTYEEKREADIVQNIINGTLEVEDTRTAKEKFIDYLKENNNANCTDEKCSYTFKVYGIDDTSYYTVDFVNKKFIYQNYSSGSSYQEYNYGNDSGYAKDVSTVGWTVTTEVNVTFDDVKGEYNYNWTSSMQGVDSVAKAMASQVNNLRNEFKRWCNKIEINPNEL